MDNQALIDKINSFERWHYQFDLNGNLTPIADPSRVNRHLQRKAYFFEPLVKLCGGSLKGKRVLDIGCNAGFWSLQAIEAGCEYIFGIDGRQMHVEQANLVFETKGIENNRYDFVQGDIFEYDFAQHGEFDIVFYFGLMYHINKPVVLMEKIAEVNSDIVVIDTDLSTLKGPFLEIHHEPLDDPRNAVFNTMVLWPTKQAVAAIARQSGYDVIMLEPKFTDYTGSDAFQADGRRAFICAKKSDLSGLSDRAGSLEEEPPSRFVRGVDRVFRKLGVR
jgi:tRNA (mo5U34)-methyltransferase